MNNVKKFEKEFKGEEWQTALDKSFKKAQKNVEIKGFRKGSVPKDIFLKKYGVASLFEDAVDLILNDNYGKMLEESKTNPVCQPRLDIKKIDENSVTLELTIIERPEITLGNYKDLGIKKDKVKVTKEEIDAEIKRLAGKFAEIVVKEKGKVEEGNTAVINFKGIVDGKELEGGSGENYPLEIGSHSFIPGFEEGLVGMEIGEEKVLELTFPENYTKELAGKAVSFTVKVNEIKERILPKFDKEFFEDLGYKDVNTKEELETKVKEDLTSKKEKEVQDKHDEECLKKAVSEMKIEINPEILDDEVHRMIHQIEDNLKYQGITLEQYLQFTGTTHEDLHKNFEGEATNRIKERYLLEKVAEVENIQVTDKDVENRLEELAKTYGMEKDSILKEFGGKEMVEYDVKMRKAIEIVVK